MAISSQVKADVERVLKHLDYLRALNSEEMTRFQNVIFWAKENSSDEHEEPYLIIGEYESKVERNAKVGLVISTTREALSKIFDM